MAVNGIDVPMPVFLPGGERNWAEVPGIATINADGMIVIKLRDPEDAKRLLATVFDGILLAVGFDYQKPPTHKTRFDVEENKS